MSKNTIAKIKINFSASCLDGQTMGLSVLANDLMVFEQTTNLNKTFVVELDLVLPGKIKFITNGKNQFDTKVDENGNILQDKYIKIDKILVDRMVVPQWIIESKLLKFEHNNQVHYTNYFGYNGQGTIQIPEDVFSMFLELLSTG